MVSCQVCGAGRPAARCARATAGFRRPPAARATPGSGPVGSFPQRGLLVMGNPLAALGSSSPSWSRRHTVRCSRATSDVVAPAAAVTPRPNLRSTVVICRRSLIADERALCKCIFVHWPACWRDVGGCVRGRNPVDLCQLLPFARPWPSCCMRSSIPGGMCRARCSARALGGRRS